MFGPSKFLIDQKRDFPNVLILILSKLDSFQLENNHDDQNFLTKDCYDTLVCDDDAHKVFLCTRSHFFCTRWVKKIDLKDTPHNKGDWG